MLALSWLYSQGWPWISDPFSTSQWLGLEAWNTRLDLHSTGDETKALCMLGKRRTNWATSRRFFSHCYLKGKNPKKFWGPHPYHLISFPFETELCHIALADLELSYPAASASQVLECIPPFLPGSSRYTLRASNTPCFVAACMAERQSPVPNLATHRSENREGVCELWLCSSD